MKSCRDYDTRRTYDIGCLLSVSLCGHKAHALYISNKETGDIFRFCALLIVANETSMKCLLHFSVPIYSSIFCGFLLGFFGNCCRSLYFLLVLFYF